MTDNDYFVLTDALREWSSRQRFEAQDEPGEHTRTMRLTWAADADALLTRVEDTPNGVVVLRLWGEPHACQKPRPAWGTCTQAMAAGNILHTDLCPACTTTFMQVFDAVTPGLEWHQNFRNRAACPVHPDAPGDH